MFARKCAGLIVNQRRSKQTAKNLGEKAGLEREVHLDPYRALWCAVLNRCLKDAKRFVQRPQNAGVKQRIGLQWWMPRTVKALGNSMIGQDDPDHRRLRGLVDGAFTRRGVEVLRGRIEDITDGLLDQMAHVSQPDLVEQLARRLPLMVIADDGKRTGHVEISRCLTRPARDVLERTAKQARIGIGKGR